MAISPEPNPDQNDNTKQQNDDTSFSYFLKTVLLRDWWLIKSENDVEGKSLCISGYASTKKEAQRLFNSAPITKRHNVFTLETADGIYIILQGFINKDRTLDGGFSSEVFEQFVYGFPLDWEECIEKFFGNAGVKDSSLTSSLSKDFAISEDGCKRDYSQILSKKFDDGASEGNCEYAAIISNSVQEEMNGPNDNIDGTEECAFSQNQSNHSIPISPTDKSAAILSSHFEGTEQRKKSILKRKAEGSPCAEGMERSRNESVEHAELNSPNEDNHNLSNYDQSISVGTSGMTLTVSSNKRRISDRKRKEHKTDKDAFGNVVTNISNVPSIQVNNKAAPGYDGQNKETTEVVVTEISASRDSNAVSPLSVERNTVTTVSRNSKSRNNTKLLSKMQKEGKSKQVSGCSTKNRKKKKKPPMTPITVPQINIQEAMNRAASRLRSGEWNLGTEVNKKRKAASKRGSSKKAKRKISFDAQIEVKTSIQSPESLRLKRSRSGRLLLPALDFWRNQIPVYDADRNITGIQEEIVAAKPSKGSKSVPPKTVKSRR